MIQCISIQYQLYEYRPSANCKYPLVSEWRQFSVQICFLYFSQMLTRCHSFLFAVQYYRYDGKGALSLLLCLTDGMGNPSPSWLQPLLVSQLWAAWPIHTQTADSRPISSFSWNVLLISERVKWSREHSFLSSFLSLLFVEIFDRWV